MASLPPRILAIALAGLALAATAAPLQVRSLTLKPGPDVVDLPGSAASWADGAVKMPFVGPVSPVATRINEALYLVALGTVAPLKPGDSFTPPADQLPVGTAEQDFKVSRNDGRVLTFTLSAEGCGAYCENYDTVYNFDARTGWMVALPDLVQPSAFEGLSQRIAKEARRLYGQQIQALRQELATAQKRKPKPDTEAMDDLRERITLNEGCLGHGANMLAYAGLSLATRGMTLSIGRCSNHAQRALDDVGNITVIVPRAELQPLLTAYGRALLLGDGEAGPPAPPFGQVLHGKVGAASITLRLDRPGPGGAVSGHYFYDRYRKLIPLSGKREGDSLTLTETVDGKEASFQLQWRGMALDGQWQGGGRSLPVSVGW